MIFDLLIQPFADHEYMRKALAAAIAIAISSAPLGVFLMLRRMSLSGDALSHGILPGVAIAFIFTGESFWHMTIGGIVAGITMAILTISISRSTGLKEDASFAGIYLISLAIGVLLLAKSGGDEELLHMLFGHITEISSDLLLFASAIASISLVGLAVIYRALVMECVDPVFMKATHGRGAVYHNLFLILVVLNLVASFQALGTLMALGLMLLPAITSRFWANNIDRMVLAAIITGVISAIGGLLVSYHQSLPPGPSVVLSAGVIYVLSIFFGKNGIIAKFLPHRHLEE